MGDFPTREVSGEIVDVDLGVGELGEYETSLGKTACPSKFGGTGSDRGVYASGKTACPSKFGGTGSDRGVYSSVSDEPAHTVAGADGVVETNPDNRVKSSLPGKDEPAWATLVKLVGC